MAETFRYLLGEHGVFEGTPEDVLARGFDPWQAQLFTEATNPMQFGEGARFTWSGYGLPGGQELGLDYATGYVPTLLDLRAAVTAGTATAQERQQYAQMVRQAQAIPLRDAIQLTYDAGTSGTGQTLSGASPDLGGILLRIADRMDAGTATEQERDLFRTTEQALRYQDWTASVPQPSDAFNPLGDQFMMALNALSLATGGAGSFGAFGAAAGAGAGAGASVLGMPTATLAQVGTLSGLGAMGTGMLGTALQQPWLQKLAMGLGVVGGLAGGTAGIANATQGGLQNLGEAARLVQGASRVTGALGTASGVDALQRAAGYLRLTGQAGDVVSGAWNPDVTSQAPGGNMEWDYSWDYGDTQPYDNWSWDYGATDPAGYTNLNGTMVPSSFLGWGGDETQQGWYQGADLDTGGSGLWSTLGGLASGLGGFLKNNSSWLGPAVSGLAGLGTGALGSQASRDAAAAQSDALNRALALQEAQWLTTQANQAPWLEAGRTALGHLAGRSTWEQPTLGQLAAINPADYRAGLPSATPGWTPQPYTGPAAVQAGEYRWTPQAGPRAADYRYTPGAVPTLSGAELLANDPGYQFRMDEARRAFEASAAARGGLTSGATLSALQRQSQDMASQEYAQAWNRASQQAQMREQWNQYATQQGWSQAQAEAAFREQQAQLASQQGFTQALAGQGQQFTQGLQAQQWNQQQQQQYDTELSQRMMALNQLGYSRDLQANDTAYQRMVDQYNSERQRQNTAWNQFASLAGYGQTAVGQLGTQGQNATNQLASLLGGLGTAQASGIAGGAQNWLQGLGTINSGIQGSLNTQSILGALASLNR